MNSLFLKTEIMPGPSTDTETTREEPDRRSSESDFDISEFDAASFLRTNAEGQIVDMSESFVSMVGLPKRTLLGRPLLNVLDDHPQFTGVKLREILERQETVKKLPAVIQRSDGSLSQLLISGRANFDHETRAFIGCKWLLFDLPDDLSTLKLITPQTSETISKNREILSNASHDFLTPLNAISGFAEAIKLQAFGPIENSQVLDAASRILSGARDMKLLVNRTLLLMTARGMDLHVNSDAIRIDELVADTESKLSSEIKEQGLTIKIEIDQELQSIRSDRQIVRTILDEVIGNAVKFGPKNSVIQVTGSRSRDDFFRVSVEDEGDWISKQDDWQYLAPFCRQGGSYVRSNSGSGLGLPIVCAMMNCIHGRIEFSNTDERRSIVSLYFRDDRQPANQVRE